MDVAEDSRWQHEQQQQQEQEQQQEGEDHKKELDRNELVRARLITLSQVEPEGEVVPLDTLTDPLTDINEGNSPPPPTPSPPSDREDEFRRKLMSISYVDVPMSAQ